MAFPKGRKDACCYFRQKSFYLVASHHEKKTKSFIIFNPGGTFMSFDVFKGKADAFHNKHGHDITDER